VFLINRSRSDNDSRNENEMKEYEAAKSFDPMFIITVQGLVRSALVSLKRSRKAGGVPIVTWRETVGNPNIELMKAMLTYATRVTAEELNRDVETYFISQVVENNRRLEITAMVQRTEWDG